MANTINLANVNISIQEFQAVSSGEYNAGEVTLRSATTLDKANHHLTFKGMNNTPQSHAEILAIKDAFVRALSQNGVDANEINRVRRELGLAPASSTDTSLAQRNIRPLTRQQVRDILDRYADTLNARLGAGTVRSHAEMFPEYNVQQRGDLAQTRNQINAELVRRRSILPDQRITDIQSVIGGGVHFSTESDRERLISVAERLKARILTRSHGNPSNEPNATINYTQRDTGLNVTFSFGMSEADFIKKLDDMLAMMRGNRRPNAATMAVRREMRTAFAEGPDSVARWLNTILDDPQGAFKARTIAVGILLDSGIDDWETLSLVNKISDDNAIAFVTHLANRIAAGVGLKGDALRQSAAVAALAGQVAQQPVPAERQAFIPVISPREANRNACEGLNSNGQIPRIEQKLTHEMKTLRDGIMAEMRARYGADVLLQNISFIALIAPSDIENAFGMNENGDVRKSAADVRAALVAVIERDMARRYLAAALKPILQATGNEAEAASVAARLLVRHPDMKAQLVAAQSPEEARAIVDDYRPQIDAGVRRMITSKRCATEAVAQYREVIANAFGIPVESLQGKAVDVTFLTGKCRSLSYDIEVGENHADSDQDIEQEFRTLATRVAEERIALLRQADALEVSAETRDILKAQILTLRKVTGFDLAAFKTTADQFNIGNLITTLSSPASTQDIVHEMSLVGTASANAAVAFYQGQGHGGEIGGDEIGAVNNILVTLALDKQPGALDLVRSFFARPDVASANLVNLEGGLAPRSVAFEMFRPERPVGEANAALANSIGQPNMAPIPALAVRLAFDDMGLGNLSAEEKANLLHGEIGTAIANQVRGANQPVTPSLLRAIARAALAETAVNATVRSLISELAELCGIEVSAEAIDKTKDIILARNPDLLSKAKRELSRAATSGADPQAAVDRLINTYYEDAATVLRAFGAIEAANADAKENAVREIAQRANLDEADVRARLNVRELVIESDGSLKAYRDTVAAALANPATDLAAYGEETVAQNAAAKVEAFVAQKVEFIAQLDALHVTDAAKGSLIALALERPSFNDADLAAAAVRIVGRNEIRVAFDFVRNTFTAAKVAQMSNEDLIIALKGVAERINAAIDAEVPEGKRNEMGADGYAVLRTIVGATLVDHCGGTLMRACERLASTERFNLLRGRDFSAMENDAAKPTVASILNAFATALDNEWLPADLANAIHSEGGNATEVQKSMAADTVKFAPSLVARYSEGLDENRRTELKAFAITLDYRGNMVEAAESAIRAKVAAFGLDDAGFHVEGSLAANKALEMGYNRGELAMLQSVADMYREATGCTIREAQEAALDNSSPARRLFAYGGRFTESVENFRKGLALLGKFKNWFAAATAEVSKKSNAGYRLPADASPTLLNSDSSFFKINAEYAYEKFVFEHLVVDESLPIDVENPDALFGMENNTVIRFYGRSFANSITNTMAQVPPEKRAVIYAVFDMLAPLAQSPEGLRANNHHSTNGELVARILKNMDAVSEMLAAGTLTKQTFCERFLTDIPGAAGMTLERMTKALNDRLQDDFLPNRLGRNFGKMMQVQMLMQSSGGTLEECTAAIMENRRLPDAPYVAGGNGHITELGSPKAGREQCVLDLLRPASPVDTANNVVLFDDEHNVFAVVFPDGTTLKSSNAMQAAAIADKLEKFCGVVHPAQLNAVYFALTQAAQGQSTKAFLDQNVSTTEHMPLTYTLSKDEETGAVTIRYSEPDGFPVKFHWETVIQLNGASESTTMVVEYVDRFQSDDVKAAAMQLGYKKDELPKLARAAHLLAQTNHMSELDAMMAVAAPGSDANRLMNYGGRFLESAANFAHGLRLINDFAGWYAEVRQTRNVIANAPVGQDDWTAANTPSKLNSSTLATVQDCLKGMERFVFEELAANPGMNLAETDREAIFGFANNSASRFFGRGFGHGSVNTMANVPPARRAALYASFNVLFPLAANPQEAQDPQRRLDDGDRKVLLARMLKNIDRLEELMSSGQLTAANVISVCFPDMQDAGNGDVAALRAFFNTIDDALAEPDDGEPGPYDGMEASIRMTMERTGCTFQEAVDSVRTGKNIPSVPYFSGGALPLENFDGTAAGAGTQLVNDLDRPGNYKIGNRELLPNNAGNGYGFTFPGEQRFVTNNSNEGRANIPRVAEKVVALCGNVHQRQAASVVMMLSQSGTMELRGGLRRYGIESDEHAALDFRISKDPYTGDVKIRYLSPEGLPFRFTWTATVDVNGNIRTTPLVFDRPRRITVGSAQAIIADTAKSMGIALDEDKVFQGGVLLARYGAEMYGKNARLLARFIVRLRLTNASQQHDHEVARDMARRIRSWIDFDYDEPGMEELRDGIKTQANLLLDGYRADNGNFLPNNPGIYTMVPTDSHRQTNIVNGKKIVCRSADNGAPLIAALKQALPDVKAQKAISVFLNQMTSSLFTYPQNHLRYPPADGQENAEDVSGRKGAEKIVNRDMNTGLYEMSINDPNEYILEVKTSDDGRAATVVATVKSSLSMGTGVDSRTTFGTFTLNVALDFDLTQDNPSITDVHLSQTID